MKLLDTIPLDARNTGTINLGYEIVKAKLNLEYCHWHTKDVEVGNKLYVNIFYPTHIFNLISFLKKNNIPLLKTERDTKIIVGGQGVSNLNCLDDIVDMTFQGEIDGEIEDAEDWMRVGVLRSEAHIKNNKAAIELTRGCKYRCSFCEYGWVHGGKYREKDFDLVKRQILEIKPYTNHVNFMSANVGSYSRIDDLLDFCEMQDVKILNSDLCIRDAERADRFLKNSVKVGVESFDEKTRKAINKPMSDVDLLRFFEHALVDNKVTNLHCYLIYGLPNDDYDRWFDWLGILGNIRKSLPHPVRIEFSITNFEPCRGTPLQDAPMVDFVKKDEFLKVWVAKLIEHGFRKERDGKEITYANARGRFGRKEKSYQLLMALKNRNDITKALMNSLPSGIGRSISDKEADKFLRNI